MRAQNGVGGPPEPRSSRRQEAHSISAEGSWSLLTSAATTVQGRNRLKGDGRETAQRSLSPADARQFPPGGRPADERSTGSLLINRFAARRKYRRAPARKPILAETRRPLIRAGQYKHVHKPGSEPDAAGEMHRGRYCSQANFGQVKEPRNTQTTRNAIETACCPVQFAFP